MRLGKNVFLHQWQEDNLNFNEARLLFLLREPKWEAFTEGEKLPTEYVYGQDILKNRIKKLDKQSSRGRIKKILSEKQERDPNKFKNICQKRLEQLKSPIENEKQFADAVDEVSSYNLTLSRVRSGGLSQEHIGDLLKYSKALQDIPEKDLDKPENQDIIKLDISSFFGDKLFKKLNNAAKRMATADSALNEIVSAKNDPLLVKQGQDAWEQKEKSLKAKLEELRKNEKKNENEIRSIEDDLESNEYKNNFINSHVAYIQAKEQEKEIRNRNKAILEGKKTDDEIFEKRLRQDKEYMELLRKSVESEELEEEINRKRNRRRTYQFENLNIAALADKLSYEDKLELTNVFLELREIKQAEILRYLNGKLITTTGVFNSLRERGLISEEKFEIYTGSSKKEERESDKYTKSASEYEKELKDIERIYLNPEYLLKVNLDDPESFEKYTQRVGHIHKALIQQLDNFNEIDKRSEFISEVKKDSEGAKALVRAQFAEVKSKIQLLTPEVLDSLLQNLDHADEDVYGGEKNYKKIKGSLDATKTKESMLAEMEAQIEDIDTMSPEELFSFKADLDQRQKLYSQISEEKIQQALHPDVKMAHQLIEDLEGKTDVKEIQGILEKHLTIDKNLKYVSGKVFERKYQKYSETGFMLFEEKGDEWTIIINQDAIKKLEDGTDFRNQIIHELLHLEFEKDPETKRKCTELFIDNKDWHKIKQAFVDTFPKKQPPDYEGDKTTFTPDDWEELDVLSEIYAMQNMIFKEDTPYPELRKAIKDAKIDTNRLGDARDAALRYGIDDEAYRRRGAESGEEGTKTAVADSESDSGGGEAEYVSSTEENAQEIEKNNERIQNLYDSGCLGHIPGAGNLLGIMKDYNEETGKMNDKLKVTRNSAMSKLVDERIKKVKDDLGEIEQDMAEINEKMPNQMISPLRHIWNSTTFCSPEDFWQVALDFKEWWERRHKRRMADHAAKIGMAIFENLPIPIISEFGTEASAREQKAEAEEVNEWKSRLETRDAWELTDILKRLAKDIDPNKDQFKAILRILAEKGRIDWREPAIWILLSKLQNTVSLSPNDDIILKNPILLRQKLHTACGEIWDYDEFLKLERDNESNYDGGKQKYMGSLDKIQDQLTQRLDQLLRKHREGENVDPQEYEAIMEYCITKGKSYAENIMFHLIVGMAEGLLPPDRGLSLDKFLNEWPATQWIYEQKPPLTKKDYVWYCKNKFAESFEAGICGKDFKNFFWTEIQNSTMTIQRVRKSVSERKWDHDWGRSIACMGDANTAKRYLSGRSGQQEAKDTGVENAYVGALQWLEENARNPGKIDARKEFSRQIAWITMADGICDHVAYLRGASDIYTRSNASILNAVAREAGVANHKDWTTRQHQSKIRDFLDKFDPTFFSLLRNEKRAKDEPKELGVEIRDYLKAKYTGLTGELEGISEIDHVFDKMDAIIQAIVLSVPEAEFNRHVAWLIEGVE